MNSKSLRRLASDHADLHTHDLPPNYLWPPSSALSTCCDDLTHLTLHLAGPSGTPYSSGLFTLTLSMPPTYPAAPPTARFATRIWHPNVDEATGSVCVDALKSGWQGEGKAGMRLRDVLVVIGCLLVVPNAASALNEAAGKTCSEDWAAFERRARLMTGIHAGVPGEMRAAVEEARTRGEEKEEVVVGWEEKGEVGMGVESSKVNTGRRKGRGKAVVADKEAEENAQREALSDDEDWIPRNPSLAGAFGTGRDNAFGIKLSALGPGAAEKDTDGSAAESMPSLSSGSSATTSLDASNPATPHRHSSEPLCTSTSIFTLSTTTTEPPSSFTTLQSAASDLPEPSWLHHHIATHLKSSRSPESLKREKAERRRFKAAGYSVQKHNRGLWGPRTGLKRL
ncbi:hypothetical protein W97_06735 [Coniosporium apollinis CBS 100218]|uniref:UBC core domain-containing protein n=1 Tax=Coniosporium apollinis (strain CBS 100218) TaxID=1168221 RepID=R7Z0M3_CONA1|nr:uncharacterized protein W97_06735 [Coniosporium apollinis CBS 100218]EON67481.1 hypothetical protein W97_06735 [Coniosporium apollinis CBS 100218]